MYQLDKFAIFFFQIQFAFKSYHLTISYLKKNFARLKCLNNIYK